MDTGPSLFSPFSYWQCRRGGGGGILRFELVFVVGVIPSIDGDTGSCTEMVLLVRLDAILVNSEDCRWIRYCCCGGISFREVIVVVYVVVVVVVVIAANDSSGVERVDGGILQGSCLSSLLLLLL